MRVDCGFRIPQPRRIFDCWSCELRKHKEASSHRETPVRAKMRGSRIVQWSEGFDAFIFRLSVLTLKHPCYFSLIDHATTSCWDRKIVLLKICLFFQPWSIFSSFVAWVSQIPKDEGRGLFDSLHPIRITFKLKII